MKKVVLFVGVIFVLSQNLWGTDLSKRGAYTMPYVRYDSQQGEWGDGALQMSAFDFNLRHAAAEASNQEYVNLQAKHSFIQWKITEPANGVNIRFTLPNDATGDGMQGEIEVIVNGKKVKSLNLTSRWAYQYFLKGVPDKTPAVGRTPLMRFDEAHALLPVVLKKGDTFRLQKKGGTSIGIDFVELELVNPVLRKPQKTLSVTDFGAVPDDGKDDLSGFEACLFAAHEQQMGVYIPAGTFTLSNKWNLLFSNIDIQGAGMWHSTLFFSNDNSNSGGIWADAENIRVSHLYLNTINSERMNAGKNRGYKCFGGTWRGNSLIEYIWEDHFTVGIWTAGYKGELLTDRLRVSYVRLRNNYADGVNFAHGTSNSIFEYSDVRNCGDDGMASFSSTGGRQTTCNENNTFRWCTVEFIWRASGIGMFGGGGHKIYNNYIGECIGSSGIRFVSDFPGCAYDASNPMIVENCTVYKCGSRNTLYGQIYGALEFHGKRYDVAGMQLRNIDVLDSQVDAVRMSGTRVHDIVFQGVRIKGTGKDGQSHVVGDNKSYRGSGIYCDTNTKNPARCSAKLIRVTYEDCPGDTIFNSRNSYDLEIE